MAQYPDHLRWIQQTLDLVREPLARAREAQQALQQSGIDAVLRAATENFRLNIAPGMADLMARATEALDDALAPNWRPLTYPQIFEIIDLMRDTGWGLALDAPKLRPHRADRDR